MLLCVAEPLTLVSMVGFNCDDRKIEDTLRRLHRLVIENGGLIYEGLTITCQDGSLSVSCDAAKPAGERIIVLPKSCLLPISAFTLGLEDGKIVMKAYDKGKISAAQAEMMEANIELYNLTNKIAWYKSVAPQGLYYKDRALFDAIFGPFIREGMSFDATLAAQTEDEFALHGFINSRVIGFRNYFDATEGDAAAAVYEKVIMPFAEFLNHHPRAAGFFTDFTCGSDLGAVKPAEDETVVRYDGVAVVKACPEGEAGECFVSYGPKDALVSFLYYNYVEQNATWLTSLPMKIDIPEVGTLRLMGQSRGEPAGRLPEQLKDLKFYMPPATVNRQAKQLCLSFLFIPQENAPRAMRRVLAYFLSQAGMVSNDEELRQAVLYAERVIVQANWQYYKALRDYLESAENVPGTEAVVANARQLVGVQLAKLQEYPFFTDAGGAELVGAE